MNSTNEINISFPHKKTLEAILFLSAFLLFSFTQPVYSIEMQAAPKDSQPQLFRRRPKIKILFAFSIEAAEKLGYVYGSELKDKKAIEQMNEVADLMISVGNRSFRNSYIHFELGRTKVIASYISEKNLMTHEHYLDFNMTGMLKQLPGTRNKNDKKIIYRFKEFYLLEQSRIALKADVVVLIITAKYHFNKNECGSSFDGKKGINRDTAYMVVRLPCMINKENLDFNYHLGHLIGASDSVNSGGLSKEDEFFYGHGYIQNKHKPYWRTIMTRAEDCPSCTVINYWSNPLAEVNEIPTGIYRTNNNALLWRVHGRKLVRVYEEFYKNKGKSPVLLLQRPVKNNYISTQN
ncbi:hypothetical protein [Xenorhabdus bovienii]|uniref:hypothetical protein n=1 Tax=Xenorhabdus bovienii TaxID=40576 RepID=UPI003DA3A4B7